MSQPDAPTGQGAWSLAPPEAAGMRLLFRTAWPPALAIVGTLPLLVARGAFETGGDPAGAALQASSLLIAIGILTAWWLRVREDIKAWWRRQSEVARSNMSGETPKAEATP
ncbi:MAG: hypothetical protein H0W25_21165 [Acidimicrobiia bacterium]|nr:hypothetical protein [Acidimicrobiia bacterium]